MSRSVLFALFLFLSVYSFSQKKISLSPISGELLKNANAVIRENIMDVRIESPKAIFLTQRKVVTVLNEKGKTYGFFQESYDSFDKIRLLKATVYDKNGKRIKKFKVGDFYDQAMISQGTLFQDNRIKSLSYTNVSYPYTIVYEWEKELKGSLGLPSWYPYPTSDLSIVKNTYTVSAKKGIKVNFKELNLKSKVLKAEENGFNVFHWQVESQPAVKYEELQVQKNQIYPTVLVALKTFEIDGYTGSFASWKDYGEFRYRLNKNRQKLPEEAILEIKKITKGITTPKEKAKKIYEYMQGRTRYVNVAIGIGGWQPFPAETVHKNGYGDCKALTNYMRALLQAAGIKSIYATIRAGRSKEKIIKDFPSQQSNHVILCVPFEKDSVWLECTSQQMPFGFLGDFTDDRHALLVTEEGGKLVKTPSYAAEESVSRLHFKAELSSEGNLQGSIKTEYTGLAYDSHSAYIHMKPSERDKKLKNRIDLPVLELKSVKYTEEKDILPKMIEEIGFSSEKYATITANRMFVEVNAINKMAYVPARIRNRKTDFEYRRGFWDKDNVEIQLPEEYAVEYLPKTFDLETEFGYYKTAAEVKGDKLIYHREFKLIAGEHKAEKWKAFREFLLKVKKADEAKLVLQKKG